jgi:hypothetical protein
LDQDSSKANVNVPITITKENALKAIPEVIAESPNKQGDRKLYKSADSKQAKASKENS